MLNAPELSRIVWDTQRSDSQEVLTWETRKKNTTVLTESIKIHLHTDGHDPSLLFRFDWPRFACERFGKICWGIYRRCKILVDVLHRTRTETALLSLSRFDWPEVVLRETWKKKTHYVVYRDSSKLWSSQLWTQFMQLRRSPYFISHP